MPAIGNIVINDGAATPVAHTFAPNGIVQDQAKYADRSGGIAVGYFTIDATLRPPSNQSRERNYLATLRIKTPILEVTSPSTGTGIQPAPTISYNPIAELKFWLPERSTLQNRKDLRAFVKNLMADAVVTALVETLEPVY